MPRRRPVDTTTVATAVMFALLLLAIVALAVYALTGPRAPRTLRRAPACRGGAIARARAPDCTAVCAIPLWAITATYVGQWKGWVPLWVKAQSAPAKWWTALGVTDPTLQFLELNPVYIGTNLYPLFTLTSHPWPDATDPARTNAIYQLGEDGPIPTWPYVAGSYGYAGKPGTKPDYTTVVANYAALQPLQDLVVNPGTNQMTGSWAQASDPSIDPRAARLVCTEPILAPLTAQFSSNLGCLNSQLFHQLCLDGQARLDSFRFRFGVVGGSFSDPADSAGNGVPLIPDMSYVNSNGDFSAVRDMWMITGSTYQTAAGATRVPLPIPIAGMPLSTVGLILQGLTAGKTGAPAVPAYVASALAGTPDPSSAALLLNGATVDLDRLVRWMSFTPQRVRAPIPPATTVNTFVQRPCAAVGPVAAYCFGDEGGLCTTYQDALHEDFTDGIRACRWGHTNAKGFVAYGPGIVGACSGTAATAGTGAQVPSVDLATDYVKRYWETVGVWKPVAVVRAVLAQSTFVASALKTIATKLTASTGGVAGLLKDGYGCTWDDKTGLGCPADTPQYLGTQGRGFVVKANGNLTTSRLYGSAYIEVTAKFADAASIVNAIWTFSASDGQPDAPWIPARPDTDFQRTLYDNAEIDIEMPSNSLKAVGQLGADNQPGAPGMLPQNIHGTYAPSFYTQGSNGAVYTAHYSPVPTCVDDSGKPTECPTMAVTDATGNSVDGLIPLGYDDAYDARALAQPDPAPLAWCCPNGINSMNMNSYASTNNNGAGAVGYVNIPLVAPAGTGAPIYGDGIYHTYGIEWHTGGAGRPAVIHWFVDGTCQGSTNVFVPYRMGRVVIGSITTGGSPWTWAGVASNYQTATPDSAISDIHVVPLEEEADYFLPQSVDQAIQWRLRAPNRLTISIADAFDKPAGATPTPAWAPYWGMTDLVINSAPPVPTTDQPFVQGFIVKSYSYTDPKDSAARPVDNFTPSALAAWNARLAVLAPTTGRQGVYVIPPAMTVARPALSGPLPTVAFQDPETTSPLDDPLRNPAGLRVRCRLPATAAATTLLAANTYAAIGAEAVTTPTLRWSLYPALDDPFSQTGWLNDPNSAPTPAAGLPCKTAADCPSATGYSCPSGICQPVMCGDAGSDYDALCRAMPADPGCCGQVVACTQGIGSKVCSGLGKDGQPLCPVPAGAVCTPDGPAYYQHTTQDYAACQTFVNTTLAQAGFPVVFNKTHCYPSIVGKPDAICYDWVPEVSAKGTCPAVAEAASATAAGCPTLAAVFSTSSYPNPNGTCHYSGPVVPPGPGACSCVTANSAAACPTGTGGACPAVTPSTDKPGCRCTCKNFPNQGTNQCLIVDGGPCGDNDKYNCASGKNCTNGTCPASTPAPAATMADKVRATKKGIAASRRRRV